MDQHVEDFTPKKIIITGKLAEKAAQEMESLNYYLKYFPKCLSEDAADFSNIYSFQQNNPMKTCTKQEINRLMAYISLPEQYSIHMYGCIGTKNLLF